MELATFALQVLSSQKTMIGESRRHTRSQPSKGTAQHRSPRRVHDQIIAVPTDTLEQRVIPPRDGNVCTPWPPFPWGTSSRVGRSCQVRIWLERHSHDEPL